MGTRQPGIEMTNKSIHFELSSGVLLSVFGFWLAQNNFANGGLMLVGCLLVCLTLASRTGELRALIGRLKRKPARPERTLQLTRWDQ